MNRRQMLLLTGAMASSGVARGASPAAAAVHPALFEPAHFGAKADGKALDSAAINAAIDACTRLGGGVVYLRPGIYRSGTIRLKSNVTLYLEAGAVILGSANLDDYDKHTDAFATGDKIPRSLIYAKDAENVSLAGPGTIDGQGHLFWQPSGRTPLPSEQEWQDVASLYRKPDPAGRPAPMLQFVNCARLSISDVRIQNSPGWTLNLINCDYGSIHGVQIKNPVTGPNTDGIDLDGCQDLTISNCVIETGDDAICFKSENPTHTGARLTRNVTITNCILSTCCNAFKIGTGTQGGFENITFSNSVIYSNAAPINERVISGIALEVVDGGLIEGVTISGIQMQRARTPLFIRLGDRSKQPGRPAAHLRGVTIDGVQATGALLASSITGVPGLTVEDVSLSNFYLQNERPGAPAEARSIPEVPGGYPEARMFGMLPVSGLYARHVRGLTLSNINLRSPAAEQRPAILFDGLRDARISGLSSSAVSGHGPLIQLLDSQETWISGASAPAPTAVFLQASGPACEGIVISNCDLRHAQQAVEIDGSAAQNAVTLTGNVS